MLFSILDMSFGSISLWVFGFGLFVVLISYLGHLIAPAGAPPEYILKMEASQLLSGKESEAAEVAVAALVNDVPGVSPAASSRTTIDDEVMTRYNAYKANCMATRKTPLGIGRWLYSFDPDLHARVFPPDDADF